MATNKLSDRQNSDTSLRLLAANSIFYGRGKLVLALQIFLTVGLAILLPIAILIWPEFKAIASATAITIVWTDIVMIDRLQIFYRKRGALGQEQFDCKLFNIEWNELRCGKHLNQEVIHSAADIFLRSNDSERLKNWYPVALDQLPLDRAAVAAQRLSLGWDYEQRNLIGYVLWILAGLAFVSAIFVSIIQLQRVDSMILVTYSLVAPAIVWFAREGRRQLDAANSIEKARVFSDRIWKDVVSGKLAGEKLGFATRQIQDALFDNRSKNPMIFDWIYFLLRPVREKSMKLTAEDLVREATTNRD